MSSRRKSRFSKSFWLRLLAVGAFVALGTFAVIHSMRSRNDAQTKSDPDKQNKAGEAQGDSDVGGNKSDKITTIQPLINSDSDKTPPAEAASFLSDNPGQFAGDSGSGFPPVSPPSFQHGKFGGDQAASGSESNSGGFNPNSNGSFSPNLETGSSPPPTISPASFGSQDVARNSTNPPAALPGYSLSDNPASRDQSQYPDDLRANNAGSAGTGRFNSGVPTDSLGDAAQKMGDELKDYSNKLADSLNSDPNRLRDNANAQSPPRNQNVIPEIVVNTDASAPGSELGSQSKSAGGNSQFGDRQFGSQFNQASPVNQASPAKPANQSFLGDRNVAAGRTGRGNNSVSQSNIALENNRADAFQQSLPSRANQRLDNTSTPDPIGQPTPRQDSSGTSNFGSGTSNFGSGTSVLSQAPNQFLPNGGAKLGGALTADTAEQRSSNSGATYGNSKLGSSVQSSGAGNQVQNRPGKPAMEGAQTPSISIQKLAPAEIQVNRPATFEIVIKNVGRVTANQVQVHDYVPQGTQLVSAEPQANRTQGDQLTWALGTIEPGQERRIRLKLLPQRPGEVGSVAQVTFSTAASCRTVCTKPELELQATGPSQVLIGQDVLMNITVNNKGNGAAENVIIQEEVPDGLEFNGGLKQLEYPLGNLRPGESRNIQLRLKAAKVGRVRNILIAHAKGNLRAQDTLDVQVIAPKITATSQGPTRRFVNREATHQFWVTNSGTAAATNLDMVAKLPRGLKFKKTNNKGRYNSQTHSISWSLAELKPNQIGRIEVVTVPVEKGNQVIDFKATADLNQSTSTQQQLAVQQIVEVFFDIDDLNDAIEVGSSTAYELRVVNQGLTVATNVQLQVDFPPSIRPTLVRNGQGNEIRGQRVILAPILRLAPNQELKFVIDAQGLREGDHLVVASLKTDDRSTPTRKEESTRVYADQ